MRTLLIVAALSVSASAEPLTADDAAKRALSRNAAFKAQLEEVGLAEADLRQAGILENPRFHGSLRYPKDGEGTGREVGMTINLLDLFELPLRKRVASSRLDQAKFRLSHEVLALTTEVKAAFYEYQAASKRLAMRRDSVESLEAAAELAGRQREAGNISRLDLAQEQAAYREALAELAKAEAETTAAKERLAQLMGAQDKTDWEIADLPEPPAADPDAAASEQLALTQRWDLQAARRDPQVLKQALRLERMRLFGSVDVGVDSEKEFDGSTGYGPEIEAGIPLFDRRQAAAQRLKAETRQSLASADALQAAIVADVRTTAAQLAAARRAVVEYRDHVVPLRREALAETLKNYNFMLMGVYQLLEARRRELEASTAYVDALKDYWTKRAELERAVGGKLP